ncbi:MAG: TPM domain-containing protein [Proteobacteria bacterium]|nr:TPM domain-containing protein [Pseudomonadota bacterium]
MVSFHRILFKMGLAIVLMLGLVWNIAFGYVPPVTLPWVIDEQGLLAQNQSYGIDHILAQSAYSRGIHLRVVMVNQPNPNVKDFITHKMMEYKNKIPYQLQGKTNFLIINVATKESKIFLGREIQHTPAKLQNLSRIQNELIIPALMRNDVHNAISQGAVAITTVLEEQVSKKEPPSLWQATKAWLSDYHLLLPCQIALWFTLLFGLYKGISHFLRRPVFDEQAVDVAAMEERMIRNSLALRQQYGDEYGR